MSSFHDALGQGQKNSAAVLLQVLILHELTHHRLFIQNPAYAASPYGEPFKKEIRKLIGSGVYDDLL